MFKKNMTLQDWITYIVLVLILAGGTIYYRIFFTPKNSLELYQQLTFANSYEEVGKYFLTGYENNFSEEDFNFIKDNIADAIGQFTIFEFNNRSYIVMTTPGTERLKILAVEELPEDIRDYFIELSKLALPIN